MIPIENSLAGRVADIHHLLPTSDLSIIGEYFLPVHHQLLGVPGATPRGPGGRAEPRPRARPVPPHHPQARRLGRGRGRHGGLGALSSPSSAIRSAARSRSRLAAEIYGLDILAENVEDEDAQHDALRHPVARGGARAGRQRPGHHLLHLPRPQRAGRALQGARRLRHQRRQHDEAGELPARRKILRHAVLRRRRGPSRRPQSEARAGGAGVLLRRVPHRRRLSGKPLPRQHRRAGGEPRQQAPRAAT